LKFLIRNETRKTVLATGAGVADNSASRRTGLLKHQRLDSGEGLWIVPCEAVHSFFMKFAIDVIFLDRGKRVRKVTRNLAPWRMSGCLSAHSVLELPAGTAAATGTVPGDQLRFDKV
jgi:uncharacterized membrane protein (UPF0127 family)